MFGSSEYFAELCVRRLRGKSPESSAGSISRIANYFIIIGVALAYLTRRLVKKSTLKLQRAGKSVISDHPAGVIRQYLYSGYHDEYALDSRLAPRAALKVLSVIMSYQRKFGLSIHELRALLNNQANAFVINDQLKRGVLDIAHVVLVDDLNLNRIALLHAAWLAQLDVTLVRMSPELNRYLPPFDLKILAIWRKAQQSEAKGRADSFFALGEWHDRQPPRIPCPDHSWRVGVASNQFATTQSYSLVISIWRMLFNADRFLVRPHPLALRNGFFHWERMEAGSIVKAGDMSMSVFFSQCDLLLCGQSSIMTSALDHGVPVIYLNPFGDIVADRSGYEEWVESGIVMPIRDTLNSSAKSDIREFFECPDYRVRFFGYWARPQQVLSKLEAQALLGIA